MTKTKKPDTWEVFLPIEEFIDGQEKRFLIGKKFTCEVEAWDYVVLNYGIIQQNKNYNYRRFAFVSQNGEEPYIESVQWETQPVPHSVLTRVCWLHYSALLPTEYLTADGVRPLPWRSTLARLRKAAKDGGWYDPEPPQKND